MPITDDQRFWLSRLFGGDGANVITATLPGANADPVTNLDDEDSSAVAAANMKPRGPRGKAPVEDLEPGEGKNRDGTVRRKPGEGGRTRGRDAKRSQDGDIDDAVRDFGLTEDERERLHQEVGGRDLDRDGIRQEAEEIRNGRKPPKPDNPKAPETPDETPESGPSTADKVIAGAIAVAGVGAIVGIAAAPIPVADVPIEIGVVAVEAAAGLVILGASIFKAVTEDEAGSWSVITTACLPRRNVNWRRG